MFKSTEPLKIWFDKKQFLYPEIFFTYAVESFKAASKMLVGYELFVGQAHPYNYTYFVLYTAGAVTLLTGVVGDNFLGKFGTITYGILCFMLSTLLFSVSFILEYQGQKMPLLYVLSFGFLLVYISTSVVRNVMVVEQVENVDHLRSAIFIMVFFRLLVRGATSLDVQFRIMTRVLHWNAVVAFILSAVYFVLWVKDGRKYIFEPHSPNVLFRCIRCIFHAWKNQPKAEDRKSVMRKSMEASMAAKQAQPAASSYSIKSSKSARYEDKTPWLFRAAPDSPEETIEETFDLITSLPWVLPGIFMGNLIHFVLSTTAQQIFYFNYTVPLNFAFVKMYTTIFEVPLFFLAFMLGYVRPFKTDLVPTMIGYLLVLLAAVTMMVVQNKITTKADLFLPIIGQAHIRLVNTGTTPFLHDASWALPKNKEYPVRALTIYRRTLDVTQNTTMLLSRFPDSGFPNATFNIFEKRATTVIFTPVGPYSKNYPDPVNDPDRKVDIFLFHAFAKHNEFKANVTLLFTNMYSKKVITIKDSWNAKTIKVTAGRYKIEYKHETNWRAKNLHTIDKNATLRRYSMGMIVAVFDGKFENLLSSRYIELERVETFRYMLLIQIGIASFGNALATASYYKFIFYESPAKMRSTILGLITAFDLFSVAFYTQFTIYLFNMIIYHIVVHSVLFLFFMFMFLRRLTFGY